MAGKSAVKPQAPVVVPEVGLWATIRPEVSSVSVPEGREDNRYAQIRSVGTSGELQFDRDLNGAEHWNVADVEVLQGEPAPLDQLTVLQRQALDAVRKRAGRDWKEKLSELWWSGRDTDYVKNGHALRQIRNRLGPEWLVTVKDSDFVPSVRSYDVWGDHDGRLHASEASKALSEVCDDDAPYGFHKHLWRTEAACARDALRDYRAELKVSNDVAVGPAATAPAKDGAQLQRELMEQLRGQIADLEEAKDGFDRMLLGRGYVVECKGVFLSFDSEDGGALKIDKKLMMPHLVSRFTREAAERIASTISNGSGDKGEAIHVRDAVCRRLDELRNLLTDVGHLAAAQGAQPEPDVVTVAIQETGNAAFDGGNRNLEIGRIMTVLAADIEAAGLHAKPLLDLNGNTVGRVELSDATEMASAPTGSAVLRIDVVAAAYDEMDMKGSVARFIRGAAALITEGNDDFVLHNDLTGAAVAQYKFERPQLVADGCVDMAKALMQGRVLWAEDGPFGLADGVYHYAVTHPDTPYGYRHDEVRVWLVNAAGEIAPGYEEPVAVSEQMLGRLTIDQRNLLAGVVEGSITLDEHERQWNGDDWVPE